MTLAIDPGWVLLVFLATIRIGMLFLLTPLFSGLGGLVTVRVLLTLALSVALVAALPVARAPVALAPGPIVLAAAGELVTGAVLAFGVFAAFAAFSVGGKLLDIQAGFGIGNVYDPVTRAGAPLFGTMLNMAAVVVFFSLDGHHAFLRGIAFSLQAAPLGAGFVALDPDLVMRQFGLMFSLGLALVIPVLACLLLVEAGLGVVSRVLPQMNIFVVGIPAKIVAGLLLFGITATGLQPGMSRVFASMFVFWERVLVP